MSAPSTTIKPFKVIIPARYASTRLPGKPMLDIVGKPMIQRVYEQALKSNAEEVIVATDDKRIFDFVSELGAKVVMTSVNHPSGTDRLQEVCANLGLENNDIVVNVQGDEPLIPPSVIDQVATNLASNLEAGIATLCEKIDQIEDVFNPNAVKVIFDENGLANYFSRAPIPWCRDEFAKSDAKKTGIPSGAEYFRHIGIYAYRVEFLNSYVNWSPSMTEQVESLEQLRALSNGVKVHVEEAVETPPAGVDTEEDLNRVREIISS